MLKRIFNITEDQDAALHNLQREAGLPMSVTVRNAIDAYLGSGAPCGVIISGQLVSGSIVLVRVG